MDGVVPIRRAIVSVSDKSGLLELARALVARGVELLASGGTFRVLQDAGLPTIEVSAYTGQPQILGGRVKTLHPRLHGGILARRDVPEDIATLESHQIPPIDLVVVNLYPFEATVARPEVSDEEAIENIDIGGPSLIRAAAKNHAHVAVLSSPAQYSTLLEELERLGGTSFVLRRRLALESFRLTSGYDAAILSYLQRGEATESGARDFPETLDLRFTRRAGLRYGENPHQRAAFYVEPNATGANLANAVIRHGKELSYNNLLDLDSALRLVRLFEAPAAAILKHNNPCGVAVSQELAAAFERAYESDPVSAFGGIVALNRPVDLATAERMGDSGRFLECIVAPRFEADAFAFLTTKPTWKQSVRLLELGGGEMARAGVSALDLRRVEGGLLVQDWDETGDELADAVVETQRAPTPEERADLDFAWRVCAAVKSNAIVLARAGQVVGVGAGQMSRVDSVRIALEKAGDRSRGAVMASDAFFPFRDGPDLALKAGVTAIVQPGGSKRDQESVDACNEHGAAMVFTGRRHFRH